MRVEIDGVLYVPSPIPAKGNDLDAALDVRFNSDAGSQLTVREYFRELILKLWTEKEGFSGKRPFGNSGWELEVHHALAKAGFVDLGAYSEEADEFWEAGREHCEKADAYCRELIKRVFELSLRGSSAG